MARSGGGGAAISPGVPRSRRRARPTRSPRALGAIHRALGAIHCARPRRRLPQARAGGRRRCAGRRRRRGATGRGERRAALEPFAAGSAPACCPGSSAASRTRVRAPLPAARARRRPAAARGLWPWCAEPSEARPAVRAGSEAGRFRGGAARPEAGSWRRAEPGRGLRALRAGRAAVRAACAPPLEPFVARRGAAGAANRSIGAPQPRRRAPAPAARCPPVRVLRTEAGPSLSALRRAPPSQGAPFAADVVRIAAAQGGHRGRGDPAALAVSPLEPFLS